MVYIQALGSEYVKYAEKIRMNPKALELFGSGSGKFAENTTSSMMELSTNTHTHE